MRNYGMEEKVGRGLGTVWTEEPMMIEQQETCISRKQVHDKGMLYTQRCRSD